MNPPKTSWFDRIQRATWIRVPYAKKIGPWMKQASNLHLDNDQVMQRRDDPVSHAFPLNTGRDIPEQSSARRNWPND